MPLQLEIVSEHREILGDDAVRVFRDQGGTIGRALENDWILPDPDRYISGRHAAIDCRGGIYYIADLSTNGVYVNDENEPIGKGNPRRLFNGDRLHFGDFEITVSIDEGEDLEMPPPPKPSVVPDHIEQLVPELTLKTGVQLLDEEAITGDDAFQSALFDHAATGMALLDSTPRKKPPQKPEPRAEKPLPTPEHIEVTGQDLFDAFLDGLGINRAEFHPAVDLSEAMFNAGQVLREYVAGTEKLLASRANLKNAFRLEQTIVLPRHNNPLKLSQNTNDSLKQLLVGREGEYLGPRDAVREVCRDLLAHQDAFLDAMGAAFVEFADRFDPDELMQSFEGVASKLPFLRFLDGIKYWQMYCDLYPIMTEKNGGRFPQSFAEEFVKIYEQAVAESLRPGRDNGNRHLTQTIKMDRSLAARADEDAGEDEEAQAAPQPAAKKAEA